MTILLPVHIAVFLLSAALVLVTLFSATRTFVLPRSASDRIARFVFLTMRRLFNLRTHFSSDYAGRDRVMALYAPICLLVLLGTWLALILAGFMGMFWALGAPSARAAFFVSGSSLFTLGYASVNDLLITVLTFSEAMVGLILVALLISYLPTIYSAFARREAAVTLLEVRAGSPPSAVEMLLRFHRIGTLADLTALWPTWEAWFADIEESHTSLGVLSFFRSPRGERSWVTAAGAVLDAAALCASTLDAPRDSHQDLCLRAGYLALRHIGEFYRIPYSPAPKPDDPISITREEFDNACARLTAGGVPLKPDREQAWRAFAGWRVNYDSMLLALARLTMAPECPWISDPPRRQVLERLRKSAPRVVRL
jgi:hypothetical protein